MIHAQRHSLNAQGWRLKPECAGGALYDVGIYPIQLVFTIMQEKRPISIIGSANFNTTGVDVQDAAIIKFEDTVASISCSMGFSSSGSAQIFGEKGCIYIPDILMPFSAHMELHSGEKCSFEHKPQNEQGHPQGYQFEAKAVAEHLLCGLKESPIAPLKDSIIIAETMQALRSQWEYTFNCI